MHAAFIAIVVAKNEVPKFSVPKVPSLNSHLSDEDFEAQVAAHEDFQWDGGKGDNMQQHLEKSKIKQGAMNIKEIEASNNKMDALKNELTVTAKIAEEDHAAALREEAKADDQAAELTSMSANEVKMQNIYNAGAANINAILGSMKEWQTTADSTNKLESFVAGSESTSSDVINGADGIIATTTQSLESLTTSLKGKIEVQLEDFKEYSKWSKSAASKANALSMSLIDMIQRTSNVEKVFTKANDKIYELISGLADEQVSSLIQTDSRAKIQAHLARNPISAEHKAGIVSLLRSLSADAGVMKEKIGNALYHPTIVSKLPNLMEKIEKEVIQKFEDA